MKKFKIKMDRIRMMRWSKLSSGEKIARVIYKILKWALIAALIAAGISLVAGIVIAIVVADCIVSALAGGFNYVGYNERFVRSRRW